MGAWRKAKAVFDIYFQEGIAYRASGIIWILTDLGMAIIMPLVWNAASSRGLIQGYSTADFVTYYLALLLIGCFVTSHIMWEIATEIREGFFSVYLVRPYGFLETMFLRNLSWRVIRLTLVAPFFILLLWAYQGLLQGATLYLGWEFWLSLILGHLVSFMFVTALSLLALYTQEAMAIFELYYVPMIFLSGQLFPVSLLPAWAQGLAKLFPFYYTTGAPTEMVVGRLNAAQRLECLAIQCVWIALSYGLYRWLWHTGLKRYAAVGM